MLDSLKALGAIAGLMKDRERLARAGERVRQRLASLRCEGQAGGGAVRVVASGEMDILEVTLSPALASAAGDADLAGRLIAEATNAALAQAKVKAREVLAEQASELGLGDAAAPLLGLMGG